MLLYKGFATLIASEIPWSMTLKFVLLNSVHVVGFKIAPLQITLEHLIRMSIGNFVLRSLVLHQLWF